MNRQKEIPNLDRLAARHGQAIVKDLVDTKK